MKTKTYKVYKFEELPPEAQTKALEKNRHINVEDGFWDNPDSVYELKKNLEKLGYEKIEILYSGFSSQGDGACFTANIDIEKWLKAHKLSKKFPNAFLNANHITAEITHNYRYYFAESTQINIDCDGDDWKLANEEIPDIETLILEERKKYGNAIYKALNEEYDSQTSDEAIIDRFNANDYDFTIDGKID